MRMAKNRDEQSGYWVDTIRRNRNPNHNNNHHHHTQSFSVQDDCVSPPSVIMDTVKVEEIRDFEILAFRKCIYLNVAISSAL